MSTILVKYVTVSDFADELGVTRQRVHALIRRYGVNAEQVCVGGPFLIPRRELRKIPKNRPSGIHIGNRK